MSKKKKRPLPQSLGLPLVGVETHAHLDLEDFNDDLDEVLIRAKESGIARIGNVFLGPAAYNDNKSLFDNAPQVFFLLGIHPNNSDERSPLDLADMEEAFKNDPRLKAVGEIGLDYYWERVDHDIQQQVFREQLDLARSMEKPVAIHCRDAAEDTVAILEDMKFQDYPVLWHCFSEGPDLARIIMKNGWHASIPGPVTYPKNTELMEAVKLMDPSRIMLETDSPFLSPQHYRGKRNEPAYVVFTAAKVAELLETDVAGLWQKCADNAIDFFGLSRT